MLQSLKLDHYTICRAGSIKRTGLSRIFQKISDKRTVQSQNILNVLSEITSIVSTVPATSITAVIIIFFFGISRRFFDVWRHFFDVARLLNV